VLTAEGGEVFELFTGRYGNGANLGVLLKGHAGDDLRIDRVGRPAEFVHRPALTLGLMVQHEVVRSLADQPVLRGRGVLGRLLFSSPSSPLGQRVVRPDAVDATRREAYAGMVKSILDLPYAAILAPDGTATEAPYPLTLDEAALARFEGFVAWLEPQLADEGDLAAMTDWAGKLAGAVARIAGLLHVAAHGAQARTLPIADPTIASAIAIGKYLIPHARAAFAEMGVDADVEAAKRILRWIERTSVAHFTRRDVFEGTKGHFKRVDVLAGPLKLLADHGYIRERATEDKPHQPGQKRSPRYDVNPLWAPAHSANSANGVGRRSVTL
jgi:hypothetical protein